MPAPIRAKMISCGTTYLLAAVAPTRAALCAALEAKSRPKGPRLDRRDQIIGEGGRKSKSLIRDGLKAGKPPKPRQEPAGRQRNRPQPDPPAVQLLHLAAQIGDSVDQSKVARLAGRPEGAGEEFVLRPVELAGPALLNQVDRSEERRVGKEGRARLSQ